MFFGATFQFIFFVCLSKGRGNTVFFSDSVYSSVEIIGAERLVMKKQRDGTFQEVRVDVKHSLVPPRKRGMCFVIGMSGWSFADGLPSLAVDFLRRRIDFSEIDNILFSVGINSLRGDLARGYEDAELEVERNDLKRDFIDLLNLFLRIFPNARFTYLGMTMLKKDPVGRGFPRSCTRAILAQRQSQINWFLSWLGQFVHCSGPEVARVFEWKDCFRDIEAWMIADAFGHVRSTELFRFVQQVQRVLSSV